MYTLGISSFHHDSAAVLIKDGRVICAAEEERFTRVKHDSSFPSHAIDFCLKEAGVSSETLDYVAYYEKPLLKFERILQTFVETYPFSLRPFVKAIPEWLTYKVKVESTIRQTLGFRRKIFFVPHHLSHASAAFFPSSFRKAAILTVDGVGEYQTVGLWAGAGNTIKPLKSINFPHSLGLLYSTFTAFLGFRVNEDEYKVMGLAAYGKTTFVNDIYTLIDMKEDGSFRLNMKYFSYQESFQMWSKRFEALFGKPRQSNTPITKREKDIAASIQYVTEENYFRMLQHLYSLTKTSNLCVGGGLGLNALANGKIYSRTPFKKVYVFGPSGDSGGAAGAALFAYHHIIRNKRRNSVPTLFLGPSYTNAQIENVIRKHGVAYRRYTEDTLIKKVAKLLYQNKTVAWFQGRMEYGPRALGARSILANPSVPSMKETVNRIKGREQFRPFAGAILQEYINEYFKVPKTQKEFPFMTFCFSVKEEKRREIAAIVHRDGTSRVQTVRKKDGRLYKLIVEFSTLSGIPCLLNTSFNRRGEPIVDNPDQAVEDFLHTTLDYLAIGDYLVSKH